MGDKRDLSRELGVSRKNDPETLEFITSLADKFGPMAEIGYEGPADHVLKERLVEIRRQQIQDAKDELK